METVDGKEMDFSTGYQLNSISIVHEAIGIGPTALTRQTRQANLRSEGKKEPLTIPITLEKSAFIPLPK